MPKLQSFDHAEFRSHFPQRISKALVDYVTDVALIKSRYLFTRRYGSFQYGYCTHCKKESMTIGFLKHNEESHCPKCKSRVIVKASGRGRKKLIDEVYFVYFEKSEVNPQAITARGIYAIRNYTGDYMKTETVYKDCAMYLFEPGNSRMMYRYYWCSEWHESKNVRSLKDTMMKYKRCTIASDSIQEAVNGTQFQYCTWEKYEVRDPVLFFDLAAKYPCVEYLTKLGLRKLVEAKLYCDQTYGVVNWRGKTIDKVLRLSKAEIKELRSVPFTVTAQDLNSYHKYKKIGMNLTFQEAHLLSELAVPNGYWYEIAKKLFHLASFEKISRYILKQLRRSEDESHYMGATSVLGALRDYVKDCEELGMDLKQNHVLFPNDLYKAHQETIRKVKIKVDETLNVKIADRLRMLKRFCFEYAGFILRPAASSIELFDEGKALEHCVGGYAKNYAEGKTDLFVLRRASDPDIPFYTVEISGFEIRQVRGKKNCSPDDDVKAFVEAFKNKKLSKKQKSKLKMLSA
jgi:DNA-directed RNA polymerase subunit RPC12/RpoP